MSINRHSFDQAIANMYSSPIYANSYLFYAHLIGMCHVHFDNAMQAPAAINFTHDHYNLYINLTGIDILDEQGQPAVDENGKPIHMPGFDDLPLEQRLGILKHEMLHILNGHIARKEDRDHILFNYATDCAINQFIDRHHLPDKCIFPDNLLPTGTVPEKLTAEQYYELIYQQAKKSPKSLGGKGSSSNKGKGELLDDHSKWDESVGDEELRKDLTKDMIEKAGNATAKSRGNTPSAFSDWLELNTIKREVDWRQVLRNIVGNKRINTRRTIQRQDRRLPNFEWIKGRTKDRQFDLLVIADVSGSVDDEAFLRTMSEVQQICRLYNTPVNLIQVDTEPSSPEKLTAQTRKLERKACGGTFLSPALQMAAEHRLNYDAIIVTTDGELSERDVEAFLNTNKRVIWLIEKTGTIMPAMKSGRMIACKLKS